MWQLDLSCCHLNKDADLGLRLIGSFLDHVLRLRRRASVIVDKH